MITKDGVLLYGEYHRIVARAEDYIYLLPHPALQKWISNYTITFPNNISLDYSIIPHGCATLVFSMNGDEVSSSLFGPISKLCEVGRQANAFHALCIIEFQPAGLFAFTGIDQKELTDQIIPFELINPALNQLLSEKLIRSQTIYDFITDIEQIFLTFAHKEHPNELCSAVHTIINTGGNIRNKELSSRIHYSERHLDRIFNQHLGMSIKSFSRLVRINKAIKLLRYHQNTITSSGIIAGYYDLSHFIHEFKSICDITPQEYLASMSDFYSEIAKF